MSSVTQQVKEFISDTNRLYTPEEYLDWSLDNVKVSKKTAMLTIEDALGDDFTGWASEDGFRKPAKKINMKKELLEIQSFESDFDDEKELDIANLTGYPDVTEVVNDNDNEPEIEMSKVNTNVTELTTKSEKMLAELLQQQLTPAAVKQSTPSAPPVLTIKQPEPQSTPAAVKQPEPQSTPAELTTPVYIENPIVKTLSRAKRINIRCQFAQENGETPDQVATWCVDNVGLTRGNSNWHIRKYWVGECVVTRLGQGGDVNQPKQASKQVDSDETQPADGDVYFESPTTKNSARTKRISKRVEFAQRNGETPDQVATWCVDNVGLTRGNSNYYIRKYWVGECGFTRLGQGGLNTETVTKKVFNENEQAIVDHIKSLKIEVINRAVNELGLSVDEALKIVDDLLIDIIKVKLSNKSN